MCTTRDVRAILGSGGLTSALDLGRPVAVSLIAILQFVVDDEEAHQIVAELMAPLPAGSRARRFDGDGPQCAGGHLGGSSGDTVPW